MGLNWLDLTKERDKWIAHNFPDGPPYETVFGVFEEVGELTHHHLKRMQGIRGNAEDHEAGAKDSIGDIIIYLLGVMSQDRYWPSFVRLTNPYISADHALLGLQVWAGRLSSKTGPGMALGVQSRWAQIEEIIAHCIYYCHFQEWNFEQIVTDTWNHVKQRDWKANNHDGGDSERQLQEQ